MSIFEFFFYIDNFRNGTDGDQNVLFGSVGVTFEQTLILITKAIKLK